MKLTDLIAQATILLREYGDLEVLSKDLYAVTSINREVAEGLPKNYNMPDGYEFIQIMDVG